jgi:hypothetical protein
MILIIKECYAQEYKGNVVSTINRARSYWKIIFDLSIQLTLLPNDSQIGKK